MSATEVLVVGAGPTGLFLALRLHRHGVAVRIVDRNAGPGTASRAMVVHARTMEFYDQIGLAEEVLALGIPIRAGHLREGGTEVATIPIGDIGRGRSKFPFILSLPQDDHERFLVAQLAEEGIAVEWGTELVRFEDGAGAVRAVLSRGGVEETVEAAFLCGCDGAHSAVRHGLGLEFPGGTYEQSFYVADARTDSRSEDLFVNLGRGGFGLMLPIRSTGMHRLIGLLPEEMNGRKDITFEMIRPYVEAMIGVRVEEVNWFSTYRTHHRVAAHFRVGRAFIAGDAGHIHSPAGGQGMNTGLGDAANLAWKLADVLRGRATEAILNTYDSERTGFARTLVATTDRAFRGIVSTGTLGRLMRRWVIPGAMTVLTRLGPTRRLLFETVSQTRIAYPDSALSEGRAGRVQGGDRMPWVPSAVAEGERPSAIAWQVHVHGEVSEEVRREAGAQGVPVVQFTWTEAASRAGLRRDAAYLIRPDGHVALADAEGKAETLRGYLAGRGLSLGGITRH